MARETVGFGSWEELTEVQREDLINKEIWKPEVQDRLRREARRAEMGEDDVDYDEGEGEEDEGSVPVEGSKQLKKAAIKVEQQQKKQLKKLKKK